MADRDARPSGFDWPWIAVLSAAVLVALALYGVGVLLPYLVNDLHRLPLAEVASGAHDPKDLWPQNAWAGAVQLAGFVGLALVPVVALTAVVVGAGALVLLWRAPGAQRVIKSLALLVVVGVSVAALSFLSSQTGQALSAWRLD